MNTKITGFCLYHTSGCHLCEEAELIVEQVTTPARIPFSKVDIADDDLLLEAYGIRIPVFSHLPSGRELGWPFNAAQLQHFIQQEFTGEFI